MDNDSVFFLQYFVENFQEIVLAHDDLVVKSLVRW